MTMTEKVAELPEKIKKAAGSIKKIRPAYSQIVDFYEKIFTAQEKSAAKTEIKPFTISDDIVSIKTKEKFPLISLSEFSIDVNSSRKLFKKICKIINKSGNHMSAAAEIIFNANESKKIDFNELYAALLNDDDASFGNIALKLNTDREALAFISYNSIKPSLSLFADSVSKHINNDNPWEKGYCPVCGNTPVISSFESDGKRFLTCSFCWHKWTSPRLFCPFCENREAGTLHYLFSEDEQEYRIDVCDKCKRYIKNVDTRILSRFVYLPLEQVATFHLDIMAREKGFESGVPLEFQV
ncbi:MAG: formate dehydrogenase accessory protein FdhE [Desulfobacteraceae bacterium]|nr:MAG: formate dehydrogenase accessory protein FdhE [Desulfobacteraceae bacterium]